MEVLSNFFIILCIFFGSGISIFTLGCILHFSNRMGDSKGEYSSFIKGGTFHIIDRDPIDVL